MGTSTSSSGPGSSVPFDPPWLEPLQTGLGGIGGAGGGSAEEGEQSTGSESQTGFEPHQPDAAIAPPRRFAPARRELGGFARTGDGRAFRRAVGHYSKSGMGGARRAAGRMRAATVAAGGLVSFLQAARTGTDGAVRDWIQALTAAEPSVREVIDAIVREVVGAGGSVDEDSIRDSMSQAFSELLELQPDINPLNMSDDNIWSLVEEYLAVEACNRLRIDIGQLFESASLSPVEIVRRTDDMREYMKAEISAHLGTLREDHPSPNPNEFEKIMQQALANTFLVFEGELQ
ncbi:Qat anti-phage system associated protein QatB [Burkholderia sp. Ax-1719]|uniref:Qat anti-phage system associated protein QatB n=1 Tax=Burkholderia sp. Ax-1719 TaxID=2608334 RepID=UPI0031F50B29